MTKPRLSPARYVAAVLLLALALPLVLAACSSTEDVGPGGPAGTPIPAETPEPEDAGGGSENGEEDSGEGEEIDACAILRPEDVQPLIGSTPQAASEPIGPFQSCSYFDTATNFVQMQVCRCLQGDEFDSSVESGAELFEVEAKPVTGVGDKAYWLEGILWVQDGDVAMNVWISREAYFEPDGTALSGEALEAVALPQAVELARELLSRVQ